MLIKNQLSSILLTTVLATTASFADYTAHHDALDVATPATKTPSITTSPHVLREIKSTLDQLEAGEAKFQETKTYLIGELSRSLKAGNIHSSRAISDKEFRVPALRRKFQGDAKKSIKKKQSELYAMIQAEKFSPDIAAQVLGSLKRYASKIGYKGFCRSYQETFVNAALALDPVREDQHRKFKLVAKRFTDTLSSKTPIDDDEFDKVKKTLEKWNPTIDFPTVHTIGGAFSDAQSDFDFAHKDLRSKLQELLEAAHTKQKERNASTSNSFLDKMIARGRKSAESVYWNMMSTFFDFRL